MTTSRNLIRRYRPDKCRYCGGTPEIREVFGRGSKSEYGLVLKCKKNCPLKEFSLRGAVITRSTFHRLIKFWNQF